MKATELIQILAGQIADGGDLDVYIPSSAAHYARVHQGAIKAAVLQPKKGTRTQYIDASQALGFAQVPEGAVRGIVLG